MGRVGGESMRPRTLAVIFGAFFAVVAYFAWTFAAALKPPGWFPADITRWIYTTYMLVAAIFLVGLGGLARRLIQRQKPLGRFIAGPAAASAFILGASGMMLPGADGFAQSQFVLNAALILGMSYSWIGIGAYVAATVAALVSRGGGKGKRK